MGVRTVQFIGGEPTLHPSLPALVSYARMLGLTVEVFTNLVHITEKLWETFAGEGVSLATSFYSDDPAQHQAITRRPTYHRTRANIDEALRRGIPVRAGIIDIGGDQRAREAGAQLVDLGVPMVGYDRLREVGRGVRADQRSLAQLCGRCGTGTAAIGPDGSVWPCVFSRWLPIGNVHDTALHTILTGDTAANVQATLRAEFDTRPAARACVPNMCNPQCGPSCSPACRPAGNCGPAGACAPDYR
ncbi:hypothetical protein GCM10022222_51440 [Amycolatopsis ultiminotia]|uniref:Radical SAM protein n=2 Tax=Amycolatopsis ultiminotia TaxID=543629 RepID=A0ABP6X5J8_9PSEU